MLLYGDSTFNTKKPEVNKGIQNEKIQLMSKEEIEERNRYEQERLAKKLRYTERKSIDSYIGSILSLELF